MARRPSHPMKIPRLLLALLCLCPLLTGCLSTKYKRAPKDTPPPPALNLVATDTAATATLHTVIVFKGPGSWKKEAYWDEYVFTLANHGPSPLVVESAEIIDLLGAPRSPGTNPWALEKQSRALLKDYEKTGRKILIGAGLTVAWVTVGGLAYGAAYAGAAGAATVAGTAFLLAPVWAIGTGVRTISARHSIADEFHRRRLALPLVLTTGESKQGSLFFPVTPGPQRLLLHCRSGGTSSTLVLDLAPIAGLHLAPEASAFAPK